MKGFEWMSIGLIAIAEGGSSSGSGTRDSSTLIAVLQLVLPFSSSSEGPHAVQVQVNDKCNVGGEGAKEPKTDGKSHWNNIGIIGTY